uniref:Solute carrier family 2 member 10 n=7 Tax=Catarrhini TaxID=9526 RepID=A0A087WUH5_HUMAN
MAPTRAQALSRAP